MNHSFKMSKLLNLNCRNVLQRLTNKSYQQIINRTFLSNAYYCQEVWNSRLKLPIFQKVEFDKMYHELDTTYNKTKNVSAVDIDIFANAVTDDTHVDELLDLLHKLRLSAETGNTLPSTGHAVIRYLSDLGYYDRLLDILDDRINYGVFLSNYSANLLLDTFWKKKNYAAGARVGSQMMLQEDFNEPLVKYLTLLHCYKFLQNPEGWIEPPPPEEPVEEVKIRVKFLRNPFHDDHFDLKNPVQIVGKTLAMAGGTLNDSLGRTFQLVGLALHNKHDTAKSLITKFQNQTIIAEALQFLPENDEVRLEAQKLSNENINIEDYLVEKIKATEKSCVEKDITEQCKTYEQWNQIRDEALTRHLKRLDVQNRLTNVEESQKILKEKELKLWFFDREEQLELDIDAKRIFYHKRWFGKKKKPRQIDENYVPPELKPVYGKKK